jgi:hypothetical protein
MLAADIIAKSETVSDSVSLVAVNLKEYANLLRKVAELETRLAVLEKR